MRFTKILLMVLISTFIFSGCGKKTEPTEQPTEQPTKSEVASINSFTSEALKFKVTAPEDWEVKLGDVEYIASIYKPETDLGMSITANQVVEGEGNPQTVLDNIKIQYLNDLVTYTAVEEKTIMGLSFVGTILVSSDPEATTDLHIYAGQNEDITTAIILQVPKDDIESVDYMLSFIEKI